MGGAVSRTKFSRTGLQARLFVAFVVVAAVPLLIFHGLQRVQVDRHAAQHAEALASRLADVQQRRLDAEFRRLHDQLDLVASRTQMRLSLAAYEQTGDARHLQMIERILGDALVSLHEARGIWLRDVDGRVVARAVDMDADDVPAVSVSATPTFEWGERGVRSIWLGAPLRVDGRAIGSLQIRFDTTSLRTVVEDFRDDRVGGNSMVVLRDRDGRLRSFRARAELAHAPAETTLVAHVARIREQRDDDCVYATRPLSAAHGYVIAEVAKSTVVAAARGQMRILGLNLAALLTLSTLAAWLAARMIARPVRDLREATLRLRRGQDGVRVSSSGWGEFSVLNRSFNAMAAHLERNRHDLQHEIQRSRAAQRELTDMANHDALTGLWNRRRFLELLRVRTNSPDGHGTILYLDLDAFKPINDHFGHEVGDETLCVVAERLQRLVRAEDHIARLGGDEFAVLLAHEAPVDEIRLLTDRIRSALAHPMMVHGYHIRVRCSVGSAQVVPGRDALEILDVADRAMYRDKAEHRRFRDDDSAMQAAD